MDSILLYISVFTYSCYHLGHHHSDLILVLLLLLPLLEFRLLHHSHNFFCRPDIGLWLMAGSKGKFVFNKGEIDVATPGVAFATLGAERGSWSFLNQHSSPWLMLLLHVFVRKYLHAILLRCSHFLLCMSSFFSIKLF